MAEKQKNRVTYLDTATSEAAEKLKDMMNKRKRKQFRTNVASKQTMEDLEGIKILDRVYNFVDKKTVD